MVQWRAVAVLIMVCANTAPELKLAASVPTVSLVALEPARTPLVKRVRAIRFLVLVLPLPPMGPLLACCL